VSRGGWLRVHACTALNAAVSHSTTTQGKQPPGLAKGQQSISGMFARTDDRAEGRVGGSTLGVTVPLPARTGLQQRAGPHAPAPRAPVPAAAPPMSMQRAVDAAPDGGRSEQRWAQEAQPAYGLLPRAEDPLAREPQPLARAELQAVQLPDDPLVFVAPSGAEPPVGHTAAVAPALGRRRSRAVVNTPAHAGWTEEMLASQEDGDTRVGWARDTPTAKRQPQAQAQHHSPAPEARPSALSTLLGLAQEPAGGAPLRQAAAPAWEQWLVSAPFPPTAGPLSEGVGVPPGSASWRRRHMAGGAPESAITASIDFPPGGGMLRRGSAPTPGSLAAATDATAAATAPLEARDAHTSAAAAAGGMAHGAQGSDAGLLTGRPQSVSVATSSRRRQRRAVLLSLLERMDTMASMGDDGDEFEEEDEKDGKVDGGGEEDEFDVDPRDLAAMMEVAACSLDQPYQQAEQPVQPPPCAAQQQRWPLQPLFNPYAAPSVAPAQQVVAPMADADFEDDWCMPPPPPGAPLTVLSVTDDVLPDGGGPARRVRLRLDQGAEYVLWLRDSWASTPVEPGDLLATNCGWSPAGDATLGSRTGGHAVLHPHLLLSATAVGSSLGCVRKAVLTELLGGGPPTSAAAFGTATHAVFQAALTSRAGDAAQGLAAAGPKVGAAMGPQLAAAGESAASLQRHLASAASGVAGWIECARSAGGVPAQDARTSAPATLRLEGVEAIERMLWSPRLGLKGQLDATVTARLDGHPTPVVVPFELKTGAFRAAREHGAQVVLYTALLADAQCGAGTGDTVPFGLLHYSAPGTRGDAAGATHVVAPTHGERTALLQARNTLAAAVVAASRPGGSLPPVTAALRDCEKCFKLRECALADAVLHGGAAASSSPALGALFSPYAAHLTPASAAFLAHWDAILSAEVALLQARAAAPWAAPRDVRRRGGACLVGLSLLGGAQALLSPERVAGDADEAADEACDPDDALFQYTLVLPSPTADGAEDAPGDGDGALSRFGASDRLLLSVVPPHPDAPPSDVHVLCRAICGGLVHVNGLPAVVVHTTRAVELPQGVASAADLPTWRLDRDDGPGLVTRMRGVLWDCMSGTLGAQRVRSLVADLAPPHGRPHLEPVPPASHSAAAAAAASLSASLNGEQRRALDAALATGDYLLLRGLPGTGKTATLCAMAAAHVALGHRVLLCAHTHAAVDAATVRLLAAGVPGIWRAGHTSKVHPDVRRACSLPGPEMEAAIPRLVAMTASACASPACPLLQLPPSARSFDIVLLDEAAQTPLPLALAPLRYGQSFVLAGDTAQLAPLWASPDARAAGGEESLFARLESAHPSAVLMLQLQYRMSEPIQTLANDLVYRGDLKCGSSMTATRQLPLARPLPDRLPPWARSALRPDAGVLFLDTDALGAACAASSRPLRNGGEARLCALLAAALLSHTALPAGDLLLLTPYNAQVDLLRECCASQGLAVEATTVDRAQGRDVAVVVLSCCVTLPLSRNLLDDARRVCVALTRAQTKLCIVGSRAALAASPLTTKMLASCDARGWSSLVPQDALLAT
jgi:DNA replication ATP-dependent helicase Dna2